MNYKDNEAYKEVFRSKVHDVGFYVPVNGEYNLSRYVAGGAQNIFSGAGITKDLIISFLNKMLDICNDDKNLKRARTDIAVLCNNLLYRTRYPVDEDCALRMGAIYLLMDGENPDTVDPFWVNKKVSLCKGEKPDSELYAFFLNTGIVNTPAWKELHNDIETGTYLKQREEQITALTPLSLVLPK